MTELLNLADLLTAENQLERAEKELAKVVTDQSDRKYRVRYASILLWNAKYPEAQAVLNRLLRDYPADREVQLLVAQSYLWAKDYANALKRYTDLVVGMPETVQVKGSPDATTQPDPLAVPDIWQGYIDAAAARWASRSANIRERASGRCSPPRSATPSSARIST